MFEYHGPITSVKCLYGKGQQLNSGGHIDSRESKFIERNVNIKYSLN